MLSYILVPLIFTTVKVTANAKINVDPYFSIDSDDHHLKEISDNVRRVSGVVMGLAEYVYEMREEVKLIRTEISMGKEVKRPSPSTPLPPTIRPYSYYPRPIKDPEEEKKQSLVLADKVEKLLAMDQNPQIDLAKEELKRTVEKNFLRMLAAILVTGPLHTQERSDDIFKLMRSVLNGELDFTPVVQRLPLILRDTETNQFVNLLIALRESEKPHSFRQGIYNNVVDNTAQYNNVVGNTPQYNNNVQGNPQVNVQPNANQVINNNGQIQGTPSQNQNVAPTQNVNQNQLPSINSLIDGLNQTNELIKEIPTLVEGLQVLVESLEGLIG